MTLQQFADRFTTSKATITRSSGRTESSPTWPHGAATRPAWTRRRAQVRRPSNPPRSRPCPPRLSQAGSGRSAPSSARSRQWGSMVPACC